MGKQSIAAFGLFVCVLAQPLLGAPGQIRFRNGALALPALNADQAKATLVEVARRPATSHAIVQFEQPLSSAHRMRLEAAGIRVLEPLSDNAFFVSVAPERLSAAALEDADLPLRVAAVEPAHRLHPFLFEGRIPEWAIVEPGKAAGQEERPEQKETSIPSGDPVVGAYVKFHPDVHLETEGVKLCQALGAVVRDRLETINGLVIELPYSLISLLAQQDAVQWIEPPLPRFSETNAENRAITGANTVQAPPYGLTGSGVTALVYDGGRVRTTHQDFQGRASIVTGDTSSTSDHATHVAGTVAGGGVVVANNKGMAPGANVVSAGFQYDGSGIFLYSNPGDMETDYGTAINALGADISNNSIGTNTETNGFDCAIQGNYGITDTVIDGIVRGSVSAGVPFRVVWANGNERQGSRCDVEGFGDYYSTAPPATAKNHITVGALNANDDSMTSFSSWGPVDDGRMKPDVSAPGCQSGGDGGVTSCSSSSDTAYSVKCGTSMASPTVCGLACLLLEDFRAQFPARPDPRNSTLKILLAHTAVDLGNVGPDYQFGYGSVRIQPAIDFMRTGNFFEAQVDQGGSYNVLVVVNPTDTVLKVTIAWDDPPGTPNVNPALVNDLDLVVFDPSNNQRFPWTLDPLNPSAPAVRTVKNGRDNIEQVLVDAPPPGVYRVEVHGTSVPNGPQPFSLCASPLLVNCSSQGVISLDRVEYACSSAATIQVVDCDLNTDDGTVETVNVSIASTSEPSGETVTLTETGGPTAIFRGTISLDTTDSGGVLLVANGDAVTATYIDADDGLGGMNIPRTANATADCAPPVISNVQATGLGPRNATITFTTNEPANATVRYGTSCGSLTGTASGSGFPTSHSIALSGLTDNTQYYFAVDAVDQAGNAASDDNAGACYTFTTPEVPDRFTELFDTSDNDLDNRTIQFFPSAGIDRYVACSFPISALPTDPAGGTPITTWTSGTGDDGYFTLAVGGGNTVKLYGTSYSTLYIGTNGYVTFGAGETTFSETLAAHFARPRIAALFDDLEPRDGGTVSYQIMGDRVVVTWLNVPEYTSGTGGENPNTCQIEMFYDGRLSISYLDIDATDGLAGLSEGLGIPSDFFETDLSALAACGPLPPSAGSASLSISPNTFTNVTLQGSDPNNDPLTYIITALPTSGQLRDPATGTIVAVPYTLAGGGNVVRYTAAPGFLGSASFQFKVNDGGSPPSGGDSNIATVTVTIASLPAVFHSFPMNSNPGWTTMGQWAFGQPLGLSGDPPSGFTGANVYGYNLAGDYPNNLTPVQYLTTTAINCTGLTNVQLRFRRWLGVESATYDHANIQVSNNGTTWVNVWNHTGPTLNEMSWSLQTYNIAATADNQPTVYLRWGMGTTDASVVYHGWNIDDIEILANAPTACSSILRGDTNFDTLIDGGDVEVFTRVLIDPGSATQPEICASDCLPDSVVNLLDVDEFVFLLLDNPVP